MVTGGCSKTPCASWRRPSAKMVAGWNGVTDSAASTWGRLAPLRTSAARAQGRRRRASSSRCRFPLTFVWLVLGVLTVLEALNDIFGTRSGLGLRQLDPQRDPGRLRGTRSGPCRVRAGGPQGLAGLRHRPAALVPRQRGLGRGLRREPQPAVPVVRRCLLAGLVPAHCARDLLPHPGACAPVRAASLDGRDRRDPPGARRGLRAGDPTRDRAQDGRARSPPSSPSCTRCSTCCSSAPSSASTASWAGDPTPCGS